MRTSVYPASIVVAALLACSPEPRTPSHPVAGEVETASTAGHPLRAVGPSASEGDASLASSGASEAAGPGSFAGGAAPLSRPPGSEGFDRAPDAAMVASSVPASAAERAAPDSARPFTSPATGAPAATASAARPDPAAGPPGGEDAPPSAPAAASAVPAPQPLEASDRAAPSSPASLVARAASPSRIALSWAPAADDVAVAGYEILRGGALLARSSATSREDRSVRPGRRYCYAVVAFDAAGNRSSPSPLACASTPDVVAPTIPGSVRAVATSDRTVAVSWSAAEDDGDVAAYQVYRGDAPVAVTAALEAVDGGLAPGERHCYAVEAVDRAGNRSPRSAPACATTPDLTPPSAPARAVARPFGEHEITVGWEASADDVGVAGYEVLRDGKVLARTAETRASDAGLGPFSEHCYQVRAFDAAGNVSAATAPACARTLDLTAPTAPVAVATAASDREIALRWRPGTDNVRVAGYEVLREGRIAGRTDALELTVKGLQPARTYCFAVRAADPAGNVSEPSEACATTPDLSPPSVPGHLAVAPRAATEVVLAWEASHDDVGVAGYEVVRGGEVVASVSRTWAAVPGLTPEAEHCFAVRARDAAGNRSPVAGPLCARTPDPSTPPGPANLRIEHVAAGAQLRWEPSPLQDVVYAVYRDDSQRVGMTRSQKFALAGSLAGRGGCYRVAAVDHAGRESPKTIPACTAAGVAVTVR